MGRVLPIFLFSILCVLAFVASTHPLAGQAIGGGVLLHLMAFSLLAIAAAFCWQDRRSRLVAYAFLIGLGAAIEVIHSQMPSRTGSVIDLGVDIAGIALGAWIAATIGGLARWWQRRRVQS